MTLTSASYACCALLPLFATFAPLAPIASIASIRDAAVYNPSARPLGRSYGQWSASWWRWFMQHPVANHPGTDNGTFDVSSGQSGEVWFLAAPIDFGAAVPRTRHINVPEGKRLFVALANAEMSSLEGVPLEEDQREIAGWLADHIVGVSCTIDGIEVDDIDEYRCVSPQFTFTAPTPWIFGPLGEGETGTSVADGYFVFLKPMEEGVHRLHITGGFHFEAGELGPVAVDLAVDMTYVITVDGC